MEGQTVCHFFLLLAGVI